MQALRPVRRVAELGSVRRFLTYMAIENDEQLKEAVPLVPKLHFGMPTAAKLSFALKSVPQ